MSSCLNIESSFILIEFEAKIAFWDNIIDKPFCFYLSIHPFGHFTIRLGDKSVR